MIPSRIVLVWSTLRASEYGSFTSVEYSYLSSSIVKEIASYGGDITQFVPQEVVEDVYNKLYKPKEN